MADEININRTASEDGYDEFLNILSAAPSKEVDNNDNVNDDEEPPANSESRPNRWERSTERRSKWLLSKKPQVDEWIEWLGNKWDMSQSHTKEKLKQRSADESVDKAMKRPHRM